MAITDHDHLCVATVPIFNHLPHAQLERIEGLVHHRHFDEDTTLYLEDSQADALFILHAGEVKVARTSVDGREQILRLLKPGDFDGDSALFMDESHTAEARAISPVSACVLYKKDFQNLLQQYPEIASALIAALADRIQQLETQTTLATTADVATRIARYLSDLVAKEGPTFVLPMKKKDLADFIGTTPETLSRKLTALADAGVIAQGRGRQITVLDPEALTAD